MTLNDIDRFCRDLPGCTVRYPFDTNPHIRAWCIGKKMFAWTSTTYAPLTVQIKANPDLIPDLIASYDSVMPGYHMNKRHWISVNVESCDPQMLKGLIEDSHSLIAMSLPQAERLKLLRD